uniref:NADH-ubiquinone oxidoreductase chain 2 n=1 Tax=Apomecyna saltator TaxID=2586296 RepID=A0A7T1SSF8_9CUCU|nr:NADH dehydrogenase subunit 2 [Apomecyna saltator]QPO99864.1 NADH dehydrogenase subunit 2 [Apomecyna saltator]
MKFYKMLFFLTLMLGTLIAISSYSWLSMWMGLEINLLSIIPLLKDSKNLYPSEAALKYFITQALASSILLFSIVLSLNLSEFMDYPKNFIILMMNSALMTKLGAAPFHSWFPEVMEGLNWNNATIMLTWQKIAPMVLVMYNCQLTYFMLAIIIFSTILSGTLGLNQISLRKILTYSSINHIGWMLASMLNSQTIWMIYFLIYTLITLNLIVIFHYFKIYFLNQFFFVSNNLKMIKFFFICNFLSLGGLPPFLGFFPKWMVINNLISNNFYLMSTLLIVFTLISLYFYLRVTFSTILLNSSETLMIPCKKIGFSIYFVNFLSLSGLLVSTLIFNIF